MPLVQVYLLLFMVKDVQAPCLASVLELQLLDPRFKPSIVFSPPEAFGQWKATDEIVAMDPDLLDVFWHGPDPGPSGLPAVTDRLRRIELETGHLVHAKDSLRLEQAPPIPKGLFKAKD